MELWRVSIFPDLAGTGGLLANGRWHTRGRPVVYLADHLSTALLERLVHVDRNELPSTYQLLRIHIPNIIVIDEIDIRTLPADWRDDVDFTCRIGDKWLSDGQSSLLRVPSAIGAHASNYLINPVHAMASVVSIVETTIAHDDPRLWK
jgi:RES domain-containing protein